MHKGYNSCDGSSLTIGQVLDELPFGSFHIGHILWTTTAVAIFAIHSEMTPYMFPGLQMQFGEHLSRRCKDSSFACFVYVTAAECMRCRQG